VVDTFAVPSRRVFLRRAVAPVIALAILVSLIGAGAIYFASEGADKLSADRQRTLFSVIVSQLQSSVAHDQESSTVWDDAVKAVAANDQEWIDSNLGSWMSSYFGHDEAHVVDASGAIVYSFTKQNSRLKNPTILETARPLIADLRRRLIAGDQTGISERTLSPGSSDFANMSGHPAVLSVKPIVSDTGEINQEPGTEFVHIAVRYLDGELLPSLSSDYLLDGLAFSWTRPTDPSVISQPLHANNGSVVGFFYWTPFRPGQIVVTRIAPVVAAVFMLGLAALIASLAIIRGRSLRLSESEATVHYLAHHDVLTGLMNRASLYPALEKSLATARTRNHSVAVLFLDLDRFKEVNDTYGHPAGDELLKEVAQRLTSVLHENDKLARLGGDEFLIVKEDAGGPPAIRHFCEGIVELLRKPFEVGGTQMFIGVSIGASCSPQDGTDRTELLRRADVALYQAKLAGRSGYTVFEPKMDALIEQRREISRELALALKDKAGLEVWYQPLASSSTGEIHGVEALARWYHPTRGFIEPSVFVRIAEEQGLIGELGMWLLEEACSETRDLPISMLAANVSPLELAMPGYATRVANVLLSTGFDPRKLELEVTETAFAEKGNASQNNMRALREIGVRFALDDFGTGFSSFGRLHEFQIDRIKIDRSFVQGFGKDNSDEAIVKAIVDLARQSGLQTTAEGVETTEQRDIVAKLGCDSVQGYLVSRPLPLADVKQLFETRKGGREHAVG
jgi:diguanylate cyclase (GGDEF)-like protein